MRLGLSLRGLGPFSGGQNEMNEAFHVQILTAQKHCKDCITRIGI